MAIINQYNGSNAAGSVLTDLAGTNNGTLAGAALPTIKDVGIVGHLAFSGGNGASAGNRSRVELTQADLNYAFNDTFSQFIVYRTSKADANSHSLFTVDDGSTTMFILSRVSTSETLTNLLRTTVTQRQFAASVASVADGAWHGTAITYSEDDHISYDDNSIMALSPDETISSGNFYPANSKPTIGANYVHGTTNYKNDLTGDIAEVYNFDHKLSAGEAAAYLKLTLG